MYYNEVMNGQNEVEGRVHKNPVLGRSGNILQRVEFVAT